MANIIRTYFVFPNMFENGMDVNFSGEPLGTFKVTEIKIDGVETLTSDFFNEVVPLLTTADNKWDYEYCDGSSCGINPLYPDNTFNPLIDLGLTFALTDGERRGKALGTVTASDYGAGILNLGAALDNVWYIPAEGQPNTILNGGIFIDIDYDLAYKVTFQLRYSSPTSSSADYIETYEIEWNPITEEARFNRFNRANPYPDSNIIEFGFMSGDRLVPYITFPQPIVPSVCDYDIRVLGHALPIVLPVADTLVSSDKCCKPLRVLASLTDTDPIFNDKTSDYYYRSLLTDTVSFILKNIDDDTQVTLDDNTLGSFYDFNTLDSQPNLSGIVLEWNLVLAAYGEGNYQINKFIEVAGVSVTIEGIVFSLREFSTINADKTVRLTSIHNGDILHKGASFKGLHWFSQIRIPGYFGLKDYTFEEYSIIYKDYVDRQITMKGSTEYTLKTEQIKDCLFSELFDFMIYGNELYIDDYNTKNHSQYKGIAVKYKENEGTEYLTDQNMLVSLIFEDRKKNKLKTNYGITEISGSQFLDSAIGSPPPAPEPCIDTLEIVFYLNLSSDQSFPISIKNSQAGTYNSLIIDSGSVSGTINVNGIDETLPITLVATDIVIAKRGDSTNFGWVQINS